MTEIDRSRVTSVAAGPVPLASVPTKLWGDEQAGFVNDWIYASSERIFQIVLSLPPGAGFRHSERNRTIFAGDELYHVLSGTLLLANPQTGEVLRAERGESLWFRRDTWHHGFSVGEEELRVLEYFAPPPAAGASQAYARTQPYLAEPSYVRDELLERWPMAAAEARAGATLHRVDPAEVMWRIEGSEDPVPVGILLSTEELTVGRIDLLPGQRSDVRVHGGDLSLYVLAGQPSVLLPEAEEAVRWSRLGPADGFFAPAGTPHRHVNHSDRPASLIFGVAPRYLP